jgi:hypothetical protein
MPGVRARSDWLSAAGGGGGGVTGEMHLDASHLLSHYQTHLSTVHEHNVTVTVKEEEEGEEGEEGEEEVNMENMVNVRVVSNGRLTTISQMVAEVRRSCILIVVCSFLYTVHCKKGLSIFPSPTRMSQIKLSLGGNHLVRVWLVTFRLGTGCSLTFLTVFLSVSSYRR